MKAFVPFAAGHRGSSWNYFSDIELFEKLQKDKHGVLLGHIHLYIQPGLQMHMVTIKAYQNTATADWPLVTVNTVTPVYNQTTEFRSTFSSERETTMGMMKYVLLAHTGGDVIPLLCLPTTNPWQIVFQAVCVCALLLSVSWLSSWLWFRVVETLLQCYSHEKVL